MFNAREWGLRWIKGSILGYIKGSTSLNIVLGRIKRGLESYGITFNDVIILLKVLEIDPTYLPSINKKDKNLKLEILKRELQKIYQRTNVR